MDEGHYVTELILKETEEDVARVYRQAAEETQKKLDDYLRKFQTKDEIKRRQLKAGEITKAEYDYWKTGQIMIGKRWEEMRDTLAQDLHNANNLARSIVEGHIPDVYATNHNYATFQIEKGSLLDTSYTLYDRDTVERIIRDQPDLLPPPGPRKKASIAAGKDIAWQRGQIQSVTLQSILQGESIPNMAKRIATTMGETNMNSAVRYARTATTGAENAGRVDAYERAELMGIELEQEWLATLDGRTRHSHRQMDGQHVKVGEKFSNGCKYPGDPDGPGEEIWNCRCTLVPMVKGVDQSNAPRNSKLGSMTYEEWKEEHSDSGQHTEELKRVVVNGKDISRTWKWDPDSSEFDFAIEDVMHTQGFDGLPRVVTREEFDEIYTGEQPLLLRTFSAPDAETLEAYDDMLKNGKWYVDCSVGGADYGQGMYTAGIYAEKDSKKFQKQYDGAMEEMLHYQTINGRNGMESKIETMTLDPSANIVTFKDLTNSTEFKDSYKEFNREENYRVNQSVYNGLVSRINSADYLSDDDRQSMLKELDKSMQSINKSYNKGTSVSTEKFNGVITSMNYRQLGYTGDLSSYSDKMDWRDTFSVIVDLPGGGKSYRNKLDDLLHSENLDANECAKEYRSILPSWKYAGVYATEKGYDAINAVGHGASGSYTVVLNRTKIVIVGD